MLQPGEIKSRRETLGLTQQVVAVTLSVSEATFARWEAGAQIQIGSMDKLLRACLDLASPQTDLVADPEPTSGAG